MVLERVVGQRLQLGEQLGAPLHGERGDDADVVQVAACRRRDPSSSEPTPLPSLWIR